MKRYRIYSRQFLFAFAFANFFCSFGFSIFKQTGAWQTYRHCNNSLIVYSCFPKISSDLHAINIRLTKSRTATQKQPCFFAVVYFPSLVDNVCLFG